MKKFLSLVALLVIITVSNCTQIPENNDPILGIWSIANLTTRTTENMSERQEWIFNDAFLGRHHQYMGNEINFITDFKWQVNNGIYTIDYNAQELEDIQVIMNANGEPEQLELVSGETFAVRE